MRTAAAHPQPTQTLRTLTPDFQPAKENQS